MDSLLGWSIGCSNDALADWLADSLLRSLTELAPTWLVAGRLAGRLAECVVAISRSNYARKYVPFLSKKKKTGRLSLRD